MAELARKTGSFPLFSIDTPSKLTVFGGTTLSTNIDAIVDTDEFKDGWGYLNGTVAPPEQDFNALGYSLSYVASYYLQKGIPEWDGTDGVIGGQEYIADKSYVGYNGEIYVSLLNSGGSVASRIPTNTTYWARIVSNKKISYNNDTSLFISNTLPSGAIIEIGSNANGDYIKYADGTLICKNKYTSNVAVTTAQGALYSGIGPIKNYPHTFISEPNVPAPRIWAVGTANIIGGGRPANSTTSGISFTAISTTSTTTDVTFDYIAIGKWK